MNRPVEITHVTHDPIVLDGLEQLLASLRKYLANDQIALVEQAFAIAAKAHTGQMRKSGEPYITHPVAVATIVAQLRLDHEAVIAAILHDTLEDTDLDRDTIESQFGTQVLELVDGVTKLEQVQFDSRQEAVAESFRKMLLAMARDLRVILVKLADRLHNMRTLGHKNGPSRRRIARETLEIYAPIARRLGMNKVKAELQDLGFRALYPDRYRVISRRIEQAIGNRRKAMVRIEEALKTRLLKEHIPVRVVSRVKSPWSIYTKMRNEQKTFARVMDVYGFRVVTDSIKHCYWGLGAIHSLYSPVERRFKDFIAIPKANGYQSLHTVLRGPFDEPIEVQIRTEEMDTVAERGVAAHWTYKSGNGPAHSAENRARSWLSSLADRQAGIPSSMEFLENVKIDLFPDEVYLFTPRGDILSLPVRASVLDFAYAVHTDIGTHAVAARVDGKLAPLRGQLSSGQKVEVITAPSAQPNPVWLEWVATSKARTAIRQHLKHLQHEDAVEFGHRMLDRALDLRGTNLDAVSSEVLEKYLSNQHLPRLETLLADIALGNRMPSNVAQHLLSQGGDDSEYQDNQASDIDKLRITGTERGVLSFGNCCHPVPGDKIVGYLSAGKGTVVHRRECPNMVELRKSPERLIAIGWDREVDGDYKAELKIAVHNGQGVLAKVAAAISTADANIVNVEYTERDNVAATLIFAIEVKNRKHLADVIRRVRRTAVVNSVHRYPI